ncbi:NADPH nitroreductase [Rhodovulum sp. 12E13]|uniref:3-hydroxyacyl-CoA dehydrogenase NAD-binding domain-containing protein n=1 Tax=Rhodovulum sp. 12E13 TaxID=2203891 RepID=UPI000E174B37|nr:3-hydroxyacyl-CoA dehydrogenase NAD-binding domain-containing protein [Rhodovulum sp. 12E13]RDC69040.1 NADPH nitroreductase [Rhodovulum sp. 12E13]
MIGIVGCGLIGSSWAAAFLRGGHDVVVFDPAVDGQTLRERTVHRLSVDASGGAPPSAPGRLTVADAFDALSGCAYVQESIAEDASAKRALFSQLDRALATETIVASSTSALCMSDLAADLPGRARFVVAHPATPPHALPCVEIVPAPFTAEEIVMRTEALLSGIGQTPVRLAHEMPGFAMNRLQGALLLEMIDLVREGVVTPGGADALIRDGFGMRWALLGPLEAVHLNAPGGINDYFTRYRAMFDGFCPDGTRLDDLLTPQTRAALQEYCLAETPLSQAQARRDRRDDALAALRAWRAERAV